MTALELVSLPHIEGHYFPHAWSVAPIAELFDIQQGKALSPTVRNASQRFPFLRTANVFWGRIDTNTVDAMGLTGDERERLALREGDLLVCEGGDIGRSAIWRGELTECYYQNHLHRLRPRSMQTHPEFYAYWLQAAFVEFGLYEGAGNKTTIPNLSRARLGSLLVPVPPPKEQQRIARILSTIKNAAGASEKELQRMRRLRAVVLGEQLTPADTWRQLPLAEVADTASGGTPRSDVPEYYGGQIPWVQSGEVRGSEIVATEKHLTPRGLAQSAARLFPPGTLLVAMYGATAGQVALLGVEAATNQAVCCVNPHPNIEARFLFYALEGAKERLRAERFGAAQPNLSQQLIRGFVLGIPPLDEQRRIVRVLSAFDRSSEAASRRLHSLRKVFSSALTQLLGGSE
jgi:type I restriction enzyme S subunit